MISKSEYIEKEIEAKERVMTLDAHNKSTLRSVLSKEFDYWEREGRDYQYGWDEGEINKGFIKQ